MIETALIAASVATAAAMAWLALHAPGRKPSGVTTPSRAPHDGLTTRRSRAAGDLPAAFRPGHPHPYTPEPAAPSREAEATGSNRKEA